LERGGAHHPAILVQTTRCLLASAQRQNFSRGSNKKTAALSRVPAGQAWLRPLLMTPLAIDFGGANGRKWRRWRRNQAPMAGTVVGGVMTSTLLTLVVVASVGNDTLAM
jgi:multidrug efflux pump subunit AcrB